MKKILIMTGLLFQAMNISWAEQPANVVGKAYALDGGKLLYQEKHYYSDDGQKHEVHYVSAEGKRFAHKTIDYSFGKATPGFRQEDTRYNEIIDVSWKNQQLLVSYKDRSDKKPESKTFDVEKPLVIDAGFDHFIRENWDSLTSGKKVEFNFPAASRMMMVSLAVKSRQCSYESKNDKCFLVNSSNWLVSMLIKPIELSYDKTSKKLTRFKGLANINDENGDGLEVEIRYSYPAPCLKSDSSDCTRKAEESSDAQSSSAA